LRSIRSVLLGTIILALTGTMALAEKRVALVIGNSAYKNVAPLDNPKNDAKLMASSLRELGFALIGGSPQIDLDKAALDDALQKFGNELVGADVALFYYAGHGIQVRGSNYLVPVNANPAREADVLFQMVDTSHVIAAMEGSGTRLNLVILDACRNNPFGGRGLRATEGGLAQMRAPEGTLISYATQPGNVALDGAGGNSPYTRALSQTIRKPGLNIFETFNEVGLEVMRATGNAQQPWVSTSPIKGNFKFVAITEQAPAIPAPPAAPARRRGTGLPQRHARYPGRRRRPHAGSPEAGGRFGRGRGCRIGSTGRPGMCQAARSARSDRADGRASRNAWSEAGLSGLGRRTRT